MKLTGEKYKKFIKQLQLGRDIICGSDFSKVLEFYQQHDNYYLYSIEVYTEELEKTEENLRSVAYKFIDNAISNLHEGMDLSRKIYGSNYFELTIKCSAKEKFINLIWRRWSSDKPLFNQTFEIVI